MRITLLLPVLSFLAAVVTGCPQPTTPDGGSDSGVPLLDAMDVAPAEDVQTPDVPPAWLAPYTPAPRARFPATFMWGSATAAYQIEGMAPNTDWGQWETMGNIVNGDRADNGPQSLTNYAADLRAMTDTGLGWYRFGIDWARLFPTREGWMACRTAPAAMRRDVCRTNASAAGLAYYHSVLDAMRAQNIKPLVTLHHWVFPTYINDLTMDWMQQGWMRDAIVDDFAVYASFVAAEFGDSIDWWVTVNEPLVLATAGYLDGRFPPGRRLAIDAIVHVVSNMIRAHVAMYDAIHLADTVTAQPTGGPITPARPAYVGIAHNVLRFYGNDPTDSRDTAAAMRADQLFNRMFVEAIIRGNVDSNANGTIDPGEPSADPMYSGRADYFGINYYSLTTVQQSAAVPLLRGLPVPQALERGLPKTDLGWDIHARGFQDSLMWASTYNLPIVITENGIADATDTNRPRFIAEHLGAVAAAIQQGARIVGYFHWSIIDNFEWVAGYCPRFGLFSVDYASPMRTRTARPSSNVLHSIITAGEVTDALLMAQPAYRTSTAVCPDHITARDGGT